MLHAQARPDPLVSEQAPETATATATASRTAETGNGAETASNTETANGTATGKSEPTGVMMAEAMMASEETVTGTSKSAESLASVSSAKVAVTQDCPEDAPVYRDESHALSELTSSEDDLSSVSAGTAKPAATTAQSQLTKAPSHPVNSLSASKTDHSAVRPDSATGRSEYALGTSASLQVQAETSKLDDLLQPAPAVPPPPTTFLVLGLADETDDLFNVPSESLHTVTPTDAQPNADKHPIGESPSVQAVTNEDTEMADAEEKLSPERKNPPDVDMSVDDDMTAKDHLTVGYDAQKQVTVESKDAELKTCESKDHSELAGSEKKDDVPIPDDGIKKFEEDKKSKEGNGTEINKSGEVNGNRVKENEDEMEDDEKPKEEKKGRRSRRVSFHETPEQERTPDQERTSEQARTSGTTEPDNESSGVSKRKRKDSLRQPRSGSVKRKKVSGCPSVPALAVEQHLSEAWRQPVMALVKQQLWEPETPTEKKPRLAYIVPRKNLASTGSVWLAKNCSSLEKNDKIMNHVEGCTVIVKELCCLMQGFIESSEDNIFPQSYLSANRGTARGDIDPHKIKKVWKFVEPVMIKYTNEKECVHFMPLDVILDLISKQIRDIATSSATWPSHIFANSAYIQQYAPTIFYHLLQNDLLSSNLADLIEFFLQDNKALSELRQIHAENITTEQSQSRRRRSTLDVAPYNPTFSLTQKHVQKLSALCDRSVTSSTPPSQQHDAPSPCRIDRKIQSVRPVKNDETASPPRAPRNFRKDETIASKITFCCTICEILPCSMYRSYCHQSNRGTATCHL